MRNMHLDRHATQDIEKIVHRILCDLDAVEPPLRLDHVRDLLRLDKAFYSTGEEGALDEIAHRLKMAGKQILAQPMRLKDAIAKWNLKALWLPDSRRIMLDADLPSQKQRWCEAHEVGHSIIPWHAATLLGDDKSTLTPQCHEEIEAEANYAAGQLLFLGAQFRRDALDLEMKVGSVQALQKRYGNTLTTTLWRYVEQSTAPVVGTIGPHPHRRPDDFSPDHPLRYLIRSPEFSRNFSSISEQDLFFRMTRYCKNRAGGPLGEAEIVLHDNNGCGHLFKFETFYNRYEALTLGVHIRPVPIAFVVR